MRRIPLTGLAVLLVAAACSGDGEPSADAGSTTTPSTTITSTTQVATTTTTTSSTTTTTTTTTSPPPTTIPPRYPVEEGWVVETIVAELDAGTGGLAVDAAGNLYHADFGFRGGTQGEVVYKIAPDGDVSEFSRPEGLRAATGNRFHPDGTLYQSSFGSGHVFLIAPDGSWEVLTDQLSGPTGIVITDDGRVFVEDCRNNTLNEVFSDGSFEVLLDERLSCPNGMTMDDEGNLYLVNFNNGQLLRFVLDGDGSVEELERFSSPINHVAYFDGSLFLVARNDLRIYRYDIATDSVTVIAGTGAVGFDDGPGPFASMGRPNAIAVDADGTLYINHSGGRSSNDPVYIRRIRKTE